MNLIDTIRPVEWFFLLYFIFTTVFYMVLNYLAPQRAQAAIEVGQTIPAFSALDEHGNVFDSGSLAGSRVLIKFFRGHW